MRLRHLTRQKKVSEKDRLIRAAMCDGKVKHTSREAAMITAKKMGNKDVHPYKCPYCSTDEEAVWHLGH